MKVYIAGLIDKSLRSVNSKLQKKLVSDYQKTLHVNSKAISSQELNTFLVLSAERDIITDQKLIQEVETGCLFSQFKKYYTENESMLQRQLKTDQELRETSKIIKDFIKEVDSNLEKHFDSQLKKIIKNLPANYREIQIKSYVTLWDFVENQQYRFFLSGFGSSVFTGAIGKNKIKVGELVDKLVIANFFAIFLKPTIMRLTELDKVLERLEPGIEGTHYKTNDSKLQKKLELFFRILAAKLSALQDIDNLITIIGKII